MAKKIVISNSTILILLQGLNPARKEIDALWAKEAEQRLKDIKTGAVDTIPGEKVFQSSRDRCKYSRSKKPHA